jgi:hypothetical protein
MRTVAACTMIGCGLVFVIMFPVIAILHHFPVGLAMPAVVGGAAVTASGAVLGLRSRGEQEIMSTFNNKDIVDEIIGNYGYYSGDPRVIKVVEYINRAGRPCWGVIYRGQNPAMYDSERPPDRNQPHTIWEARDAGTEPGQQAAAGGA